MSERVYLVLNDTVVVLTSNLIFVLYSVDYSAVEPASLMASLSASIDLNE